MTFHLLGNAYACLSWIAAPAVFLQRGLTLHARSLPFRSLPFALSLWGCRFVRPIQSMDSRGC